MGKRVIVNESNDKAQAASTQVVEEAVIEPSQLAGEVKEASEEAKESARYILTRDGDIVKVRIPKGITIHKKEWGATEKIAKKDKISTGAVDIIFDKEFPLDSVYLEATKSLVISLQEGLRNLGLEFCQSLRGAVLSYEASDITKKRERKTLSTEQKKVLKEVKDLTPEELAELVKLAKANASTAGKAQAQAEKPEDKKPAN